MLRAHQSIVDGCDFWLLQTDSQRRWSPFCKVGHFVVLNIIINRKIFNIGCCIYYLFTSQIKGKIKRNKRMKKIFLNPNLPFVIERSLFNHNHLSKKTDEILFGIYSIYLMGEFISSNLKITSNIMMNVLNSIINKVSALTKDQQSQTAF
jgi:hypothetical protein